MLLVPARARNASACSGSTLLLRHCCGGVRKICAASAPIASARSKQVTGPPAVDT
jgi:hypothetical protein